MVITPNSWPVRTCRSGEKFVKDALGIFCLAPYRQSKAEQTVVEAAFGRLEFGPGDLVSANAEIGDDARQDAVRICVIDRHGPITNVVLGIALADAIVRTFQRLPSLDVGRTEGSYLGDIGEIGERRSAIQALCVLKINELTAAVTMENSHLFGSD
jgi:hypothetical protein